MGYPTVKTLQTIPGVDLDKAKALRALLTGETAPDEYKSVRDWCAQCYHPPGKSERIMCAANEIIEGHGVECVTDEGRLEFEYVNMGETYTATLIRYRSGHYAVTSWGDIAERRLFR